jgi:hypothetical protein
LVGWVVGWLVGWVVGWLGGWLFGCFGVGWLLSCLFVVCDPAVDQVTGPRYSTSVLE